MELVTEVRKPKSINAKVHMIYGVPKIGKTSIVAHLPDHLILELEPNGAEYIEGRIQEINKISEFDAVLDLIEKSPGKVCKYLIVDSITKMDEWSELKGTVNYMKKPQGKKFNREGGIETGKVIQPTDSRFETVHDLGQGYGYKHSREVMLEWYDKLQNLITLGKVDYVILLAHVKDKLVESRNGDTVETLDISLTGKVKSIYASRVDAIGHFYREDNIGYISYNNEFKVVCGGRCPHLDGSIKVSERNPDGTLKVDWSKIYID